MNENIEELELIAYEKIIAKNFDRQFDQPEKIPFQGNFLEIWDIKPVVPNKHLLPLLYVPGWGASPRAYQDGLRVHSLAGRRVISMSFSPKAEEIVVEGIPLGLATKIMGVFAIMDYKNLYKVDAVGYSEGSIILLSMLERESQRFGNIVLHGAPALTGKIGYLSIVRMEILNLVQLIYFRIIKATLEEKIILKHKSLDVNSWIKQAGFFKSVSDGIEAIKVEPHRLLRKIKNMSENHNIGLIAAKRDRIASYKKLFKNLGDLNIKKFSIIDGGHHTFEVRAVECANLTESMLQEFEGQNYV